MSCSFRRILIPSDLSPLSRETIDSIRLLAGDEVQSVHLAFVLESLHEIPTDFPVAGLSLEPVTRESLHRLKSISDSLNLRPGVCSYAVYEGRADHTLAGLALSGKFDLVLLVSHGRNLLGRLMLGSVSTAMTHISPIPVLILKEPSAQKALQRSLESHLSGKSRSPLAQSPDGPSA